MNGLGHCELDNIKRIITLPVITISGFYCSYKILCYGCVMVVLSYVKIVTHCQPYNKQGFEEI